MAETAVASKARRLIDEDRVQIVVAGHDRVVAHVRSDHSGVVDVEGQRGSWSCTCPARRRCSHVEAVRLVVITRRFETNSQAAQ